MNKAFNNFGDSEQDVQIFYHSAAEIKQQRKKRIFNFFQWLTIIAMVLILFSSCKKEQLDANPVCWTCIDSQGTEIQVICAEDENAAFNQSGSINGVHTLDNFRKFCKK